MEKRKLMKVTYYDPKNNIRLTGYADTVVWDEKGPPTLAALRFGGYPEEVRGLADAIYGGVTIEIEDKDETLSLRTLAKQYRRELGHDGVYAEATLIAQDDGQLADSRKKRRTARTRPRRRLRPTAKSPRTFRPATPTSSAPPETGQTCFGRWTRKPPSP